MYRGNPAPRNVARSRCKVQDYPTTHFEELISPLHQPLPSIIINVLSLLARLTAHSSSSGHIPPTLSPLFGPLLFGLGPASLPFHHTYLQPHRPRYDAATLHSNRTPLGWRSDATQSAGAGSHGQGCGLPKKNPGWPMITSTLVSSL